MKRLFALVLIVASAAAFLACPTPPEPKPPEADSGPDASAAEVCSNLRALDCSEGKAKNCEETVEHVQVSRHTNLKVGCLAAARTKEAARACGSVDCK